MFPIIVTRVTRVRIGSGGHYIQRVPASQTIAGRDGQDQSGGLCQTAWGLARGPDSLDRFDKTVTYYNDYQVKHFYYVMISMGYKVIGQQADLFNSGLCNDFNGLSDSLRMIRN